MSYLTPNSKISTSTPDAPKRASRRSYPTTICRTILFNTIRDQTTSSDIIRVAIIGTAGRRPHELARLNEHSFKCMLDRSREIIQHHFRLSTRNVMLVSGGSAWADHVAVRMFIDDMYDAPFRGLRLYIPAPFAKPNTSSSSSYSSSSSSRVECPHSHSFEFYDTGYSSWHLNPGHTLNMYHHQFNKEMKNQCSFVDFATAEAFGAIFDSSAHGFHASNALVAQSDYVIAFTFGSETCTSIFDAASVPADEGTLDTWKKANNAVKLHVPMHLVENSIVPLTTSVHSVNV